MWNYLQRKLGLDIIRERFDATTSRSREARDYARQAAASASVAQNLAADIKRDLRVLSSAQARLIAKVDPAFAADEFAPEKRAESDKLGEAVMRRLLGEDAARNKGR